MEPSAATPAAPATPGLVAPDAVVAAPDAVAGPARPSARNRRWEHVIGVALAGLEMHIFLVSNPNRHNIYEHFTCQAAAWLEG